ncbi:MAG: hypothetical protein MRK01_04635 [Candidatus Scalindua sp.]|nr:hypothetical protein [Candidatus Scalindua sp.]
MDQTLQALAYVIFSTSGASDKCFDFIGSKHFWESFSIFGSSLVVSTFRFNTPWPCHERESLSLHVWRSGNG